MNLLDAVARRMKIFFRPQPVIYGEQFFTKSWFANWDELRNVLCELLLSVPNWRSILDFGCGPGVMIDIMNPITEKYIGYDPSPEARMLYLKHFGKYPEKYISILNDKNFDVVVAFDVLEHMTDDEVCSFALRFPHVKDIFVNISREPHIPGHINIKTDEAWIAFFSHVGRHFNAALTAMLREKYTQLRPERPDGWDKNMFVFSR